MKNAYTINICGTEQNVCDLYVGCKTYVGSKTTAKVFVKVVHVSYCSVLQ